MSSATTGTYPLIPVAVVIPAALASYVSFDGDNDTFNFDGIVASLTLGGNTYTISITLEDDQGNQ